MFPANLKSVAFIQSVPNYYLKICPLNHLNVNPFTEQTVSCNTYMAVKYGSYDIHRWNNEHCGVWQKMTIVVNVDSPKRHRQMANVSPQLCHGRDWSCQCSWAKTTLLPVSTLEHPTFLTLKTFVSWQSFWGFIPLHLWRGLYPLACVGSKGCLQRGALHALNHPSRLSHPTLLHNKEGTKWHWLMQSLARIRVTLSHAHAWH